MVALAKLKPFAVQWAHMSKAATNRSFPGQSPGEDVLLVFHQHPLVMRKQLLVGLGLILLGVLPLDFITTGAIYPVLVKIAIFLPVLVLIYWAYHYIGWYYSVYIVSDHRLIAIKQKGLFDRQVHEYPLDLIQNLNYHINGLQAVIFHYGTLTAKTYTGDLIMETIYRPVEVHTRLLEIINKAQHR